MSSTTGNSTDLPEPLFDFSSAPEPVELKQGRVEIRSGNESYAGDGTVLMLFQPTPSVVIRSAFPPESASYVRRVCREDHSPKSELRLDGRKINGFVGALPFPISGDQRVDWYPEQEPVDLVGSDAEELTYVVSHILDFPWFDWGRLGPETGRNFLLLESGEWRIVFSPRKNVGCHLPRERAFFWICIARLERKDGEVFSIESAKEQLVVLKLFLSFVSGARNWPVADVGFNIKGRKVWQSFCAHRPARTIYPWPDPSRPDRLETLYSEFFARWNQSTEWRDTLKRAVYWYTQANGAGRGLLNPDSGLILAQAGLERLAYQYAVDGKNDERGKAGAKIARMLGELNIPVAIPATTPEICAEQKAGNHKWEDGPRALTDIRNSLVHPKFTLSGDGCLLEAWKLSLWYLEMSILALCGYRGTYQNRLTATRQGEVESVPWD